MPHYQFSMHDTGTRYEFLGSMEFADDGEAFAFGERMIQDVMRTHADRYSGSRWVMDIRQVRATAPSPAFPSYLIRRPKIQAPRAAVSEAGRLAPFAPPGGA